MNYRCAYRPWTFYFRNKNFDTSIAIIFHGKILKFVKTPTWGSKITSKRLLSSFLQKSLSTKRIQTTTHSEIPPKTWRSHNQIVFICSLLYSSNYLLFSCCKQLKSKKEILTFHQFFFFLLNTRKTDPKNIIILSGRKKNSFFSYQFS